MLVTDQSLERNSLNRMTPIESGASLTIGNGFVVRFETEEIEGEYVTRAEQELRETPANRLAGIEGLRELLKADNDLKFPYDDESRLLIFLRPCKFYPQSAYELMKRYYMFRLKNPKVYHDLKPTHEKNLFDQDIMSVLPKRDHMGRKILLIESGSKWNTSACKVDEIFRGCALFLEAAMAEPRSQTSGVVVLIDQAGLTLSHVMQFTPGFARSVVAWVQECLPVRLKAVHIVNQPYIFSMLFAIFKPFFREKLRKRIHFHGTDRASLHKHINAEILPARFGGTLDVPEVSSAQWYSLMAPRNADYERLNTYGYSAEK